MIEIVDKKHSRFGIASCLIGVLNLGYVGLVALDDSYGSNGFLYHLTRLGPAGLLGLIFILLFYLLIPAIGNGLGFLVGTVELFNTQHKKLFAVLGVIVNAIIPVSFLVGLLLLIFRNQ